jgi:hypothetical protein
LNYFTTSTDCLSTQYCISTHKMFMHSTLLLIIRAQLIVDTILHLFGNLIFISRKINYVLLAILKDLLIFYTFQFFVNWSKILLFSSEPPQDQWFEFNDAVVSPLADYAHHGVQYVAGYRNYKLNSSIAYILFYKKVKSVPFKLEGFLFSFFIRNWVFNNMGDNW